MASNTTSTVVETNLTLSSSSPLFSYQPTRDGPSNSGWNASHVWTNTWNASYPWGNGAAYRKTEFEGSQVSISFTGTAIYLCFTPLSATYTFAIDNTPLLTTGTPSQTNATCMDFISQGASVGTMVYAEGLDAGSGHTASLELSVAGVGTEFWFFGGVVTLSLGGGEGYTPTTEYINNADPGFTYTPSPSNGTNQFNGWVESQNATSGDWEGDREVTCDWAEGVGASYTFTNASAAYLLGGVQSNTLLYTASLSNSSTSTTTQATYNASTFYIEPQQILFLASGLDPAQEHTLTVENWAPNLQAGMQGVEGCLNVDALVLVRAVPPSNSTSGAGSGSNSETGGGGGEGKSNAGAIAGGVVGGLALLVILAVLAWFVRRRQRRQATALLPDPLLASELSGSGLAGAAYFTSNGTNGANGANGANGTAANGTNGVYPYGKEEKRPPLQAQDSMLKSTTTTPLPSPPLAAVAAAGAPLIADEKPPLPAGSKRPTSAGRGGRKEKRAEEKDGRKGVKRKPVPRAVDSETPAALAEGVPVLDSASSQTVPRTEAATRLPGAARLAVPALPNGPPAAEGYAMAAQRAEVRSGRKEKKKSRRAADASQSRTQSQAQAEDGQGGQGQGGFAGALKRMSKRYYRESVPPPGYDEVHPAVPSSAPQGEGRN